MSFAIRRDFVQYTIENKTDALSGVCLLLLGAMGHKPMGSQMLLCVDAQVQYFAALWSRASRSLPQRRLATEDAPLRRLRPAIAAEKIGRPYLRNFSVLASRQSRCQHLPHCIHRRRITVRKDVLLLACNRIFYDNLLELV